MPPKGSTKAKPAASPATGKVSGSGTKDPPATPATPAKAKANANADANAAAADTPSKAKTPRARGKKEKPVEIPFNKLMDNVGGSAPVDVMYEADNVISKVLTEAGGYGHDIRLRAPQPFDLITSTIMPPGGPYAGYQAIIIKQSQPFKFMELSKDTRLLIYKYYLSPPGKFLGKIELIGSQTSVDAKAYNNDLGKSRLGLLRVNKEIAAEARPVLYSLPFRFDKSDPVTLWLAALSDRCRALLVHIEIAQYIKSSGSSCMAMLACCPNLQRVHLGAGVGVNADPKKAAVSFYKEAYRFLETMGSIHGQRYAGIDVISFGRKCFIQKESDGGFRAWDEDELDEFVNTLKSKL